MKKVLDLLIHLEDHKHDSLGRLFLDPSDEREMRRSLREYLGTKVSVKSAAVEGQRLRVRVELPDSRPRATTSFVWRATWRAGHGRGRRSGSSRRRSRSSR
jgi:hypothetical protein